MDPEAIGGLLASQPVTWALLYLLWREVSRQQKVCPRCRRPVDGSGDEPGDKPAATRRPQKKA